MFKEDLQKAFIAFIGTEALQNVYRKFTESNVGIIHCFRICYVQMVYGLKTVYFGKKSVFFLADKYYNYWKLYKFAIAYLLTGDSV